MNQTDFIKATEHWLELFDEELTFLEVPLEHRPVDSAIKLMKYGIKDMSGVDPSWRTDYLNTEWFACIVLEIKGWYENRYGETAFKPTRNTLSGLILHHGTPAKIQIPITRGEVEVEGETSWMSFPHTRHPAESIQSFFQHKPNIENLNQSILNSLNDSISDVVGMSRRVNLTLNMLDCSKQTIRDLASSTWPHMEDGIRKLLTFKKAEFTVSCWDFHLALEKTLKVFLKINDKKCHGHCLMTLAEEANALGLALPMSQVCELPFWKIASNRRYAEETVSALQAFDIYRKALKMMDHVCMQIPKAADLSEAKFLLKKPKWVGR
jgi:hypothetical protein